MYGKGLNSIRVRFTVLISAFAVIEVLALMAIDATNCLAGWPAATKFMIIAAVPIVPGLVTYFLTGRLTRPIEELRRSTEVLASGSTHVPIEVECRCEVGGLAEAFRKMVDRFNSNIMRMNVLAYSDAVTQLPNRAALRHVLGVATRDPARRFEGSVIFIDLDNFKQVNDTLGHDAGDQLLRLASGRMLQAGFGKTVETLDTCMSPLGEMCDYVPDVLFARFAGDEFVAVLPGVVGVRELSALADRIISSLERPFQIDGHAVKIGASVGIARMPADATDPADILSCADLAMYDAKRAGRGGFSFFDGTLREEARLRLEVEAELRGALERDDVFVEFQPKIRASDLTCCGAEALVRMRDANGNVVPPGVFVPVAESCGLIDTICRTVMRKAVEQARDWQAKGLEIPVAVNVSPTQFARPEFATGLVEWVRQTGLDGGLLEIEVTESTAMHDIAASEERLRTISQAGIRVAIDDFGTGYSNISQLSRLPYDVLKIDRSLVAGIGEDPRSETILASLLSMAEGLGYATVAEGVETTRQAAFLQRKGCGALQGFLFARAMPAADFEAWLARRAFAPDLGVPGIARAIGG